MLGGFSIAQTPNSVPQSGNVGIGTTNPTAKLQVSGCVKIDSSLTINKSMMVKENAQMKGDLTINGNVYLPELLDSSVTINGVLMLDTTGKIVNKGNIQSLIYATAEEELMLCITDINGNVLKTPPIWENEGHGMFLIDHNCQYTPRLGIGVKPSAKVQIRNPNPNIKPLLIEQWSGGSVHQLLQLDASGLLHARTIKVDEDNWPDYVFHQEYELMPLKEVHNFITTNGHLPNVPSAKEVVDNGLNLGETAKITMQKVEELTLYLIQQNQKLEQTQHTLRKVQEQLSQQQELIQSQKAMLERLNKRLGKENVTH